MGSRILNSTAAVSSDALFRAWCGEIKDALLAYGWTQTADTGQINFTTVTRPGTNTYAGYAIFAMGDALQATSPIFFKFRPGTASSANYPLLECQIGTGTNGSGTLTGNVTTAVGMLLNSTTNPGSICLSSGSTSRFTMAFWADNDQAKGIYVNVERDLDTSGATQSDGASSLCTYDNGGPLARNQFLPKAALGAVPAYEDKLIVCTPYSVAPSVGQSKSTISPVRMAYGPLRNPILGYMVTNRQYASFANVPITRYGVARNYVSLNSSAFNATSVSSANGTNSLMMLYE